MASPINPVRGMRDFLPAEKSSREHALRLIRNSYFLHGFDEIETPVLEENARLHSGMGGENEKLSFNVLRRGITEQDLAAAAQSGTPMSLSDLGLRFDLTVPLARFYASHRSELPRVFRSIQIAPVWRAERPQKGRYRQFVQCDIDVIGEPTMLAEAEILQATCAALNELGITGCRIRVNDRRLLSALLDRLGFSAAEQPAVMIAVDKRDKIGSSGVVAELREQSITSTAVDALHGFLSEASDCSPAQPLFSAEAISAALPAGIDVQFAQNLAKLGEMVNPELLVFDPFLVRGMGYYTATIFEIEHPDASFSLGGGGRYDGMIGRFLGTDVPACGLSLGFERILDLVPARTQNTGDAVLMIHDSDVSFGHLIALKNELIASGKRVRLEHRSKNITALIEQAARTGFSSFAFVDTSVRSVADLKFKQIAEQEAREA